MRNTYFFKRAWNETTGEKLTDSWGVSIFYFETNEEYCVLRQIHIFENGKVLKYDTSYTDDKYGRLAEDSLNIEEFAEYEISSLEFEQLWQSLTYKKFPEIVCTDDTSWGQPRLDGRRLAVGDIVSLVDSYHEDISVVLKDFSLILQEVKQALHYCKILECKRDKPEKYCHNCLLRVEQFGETIDEDDPEQPNWLIANRLFDEHFGAI